MLDVGFSEILLTSAIALIVLGPERLPKVARQVGNWVGRARVMARQLSEQLEREVNAEELLKTQSKSNLAAKAPDSGLPASNGAAFSGSPRAGGCAACRRGTSLRGSAARHRSAARRRAASCVWIGGVRHHR